MDIEMSFVIKDDFEIPKVELGEPLEFIKWLNEIMQKA